MNKKSILALLLVGMLALFAVGCGAENNEETNQTDQTEPFAGGQITGIDPGAGVMSAAENAIEEYELDYTLMDSSDAAMAAALGDAIANEEEIIVTGWAPHWKFGEWDLKILEDPKEIFGVVETINTLTRSGLADDVPEAVAVLDNFYWTDEQISEVMDMNADGMDPVDSARIWVDDNQDTVSEWVPEGTEGNGETITIGYVAWDCATASTHVMMTVLEDLGFSVEVTDLGAALLFQGLAEGDIDALTTAWLPATHADYMEQVGDDVEDLGPNYEGAVLGLVVPAYMDIDSIEDLK